MKYAYSGFDQAGKPVKGSVDCPNLEEATEKLRRQGVFIVDIKEGGKGSSGAQVSEKKTASRKSVSPKQVALFARELSVLIATGTPIADAVESLEHQATNENWKTVVRTVRRSLEDGETFSDSLANRPDVFDTVFVSLVAAGESSGQLDLMLQRLSVLTRRQAQIRSNVMGAMAYPVLLTTICIIVLGLMLGVVLPRFSGLFETLDTPLPASTKFLVAVSGVMLSSWFILIPGIGVGIWGLAWWLRNPSGKKVLESVMLKLPKVGHVVRSFGTARIARLLGTLLSAKVPMLEAIELTRRSTTHYQYAKLLNKAEAMVTKGEPISKAFVENDLFLGSAAQAIRNGEQSGRLADVLVHVADYLDEENQSVIKTLSSLLEPLIMIVLGGLVAFVAVSMFLPLFDLTASAGGG